MTTELSFAMELMHIERELQQWKSRNRLQRFSTDTYKWTHKFLAN